MGAVPGSPRTQFPVLSLFQAPARWAHVTGHQGLVSALAPAPGPAWATGKAESSLDSIQTQVLSRNFSHRSSHTLKSQGRLPFLFQ